MQKQHSLHGSLAVTHVTLAHFVPVLSCSDEENSLRVIPTGPRCPTAFIPTFIARLPSSNTRNPSTLCTGAVLQIWELVTCHSNRLGLGLPARTTRQQGLVVVKFKWYNLTVRPRKLPVLCKDLGDIYNKSRFIAHFVFKFPKSSNHANKISIT